MFENNYKCANCGCVTSEPEYREEKETGYGWYCCPDCGSDDISPAEMCEECGEYFTEEDDFFTLANGNGYCAMCLKDIFSVDVGYEYIKKYDCLDEFIDFVSGAFETPLLVHKAIKELFNHIESFKEDEELKARMWEFVNEDISCFAQYIYDTKKEGDAK